MAALTNPNVIVSKALVAGQQGTYVPLLHSTLKLVVPPPSLWGLGMGEGSGGEAWI